MASGNFFIGDGGISIDGFRKEIQPFFEDKGYSMPDVLFVDSRFGHKDSILVSISGAGDLESVVNGTLLELYDKLEEENKGKRFEEIAVQNCYLRKFSHYDEIDKERKLVHRGEYQVIGIYQEDNTASQLFPALAQGYLLENVSLKLNKVEEEARELLDKKLSEL
ncbi:MAG TPA: hypothetical protein HA282_00095 [Nanoarchaeota archaeon]|nr:hypothetical protein [Candidatus Pacearchaeota archaeon]HIH17314.1 hypothetical protein [Nanoarchaeota archaeon]HIH34422.1 hypothetical protein [Nanoarchaeota archaeon]HIH51595.1 hypothetical protein [Nanoarchaeota archaeon]HIH65601.1 hypothetical protein [Nanoarchaeota archaeon]